VIERLARSAGSIVVSIAAAVTLLALAVLPFLLPAWVAFAQDRAEATAWTGYSPAELQTATDAILADLVIGPAEFDVAVAGAPVLNERERGHLADVRAVLGGFTVAALVSVVILVVAAARSRTSAWRAARRGALGLAAGIVAVGVVGVVAFEAAFEAFHRLFFAGGSYTFDPRTERLVQLFPQRFWFETSIGVGVVALLLAIAVVAVSTARLREGHRAPAGAPVAARRLETAR
jgi:integral membrane protein (TIGR01906 family)